MYLLFHVTYLLIFRFISFLLFFASQVHTEADQLISALAPRTAFDIFMEVEHLCEWEQVRTRVINTHLIYNRRRRLAASLLASSQLHSNHQVGYTRADVHAILGNWWATSTRWVCILFCSYAGKFHASGTCLASLHIDRLAPHWEIRWIFNVDLSITTLTDIWLLPQLCALSR